MIVLKRHTTTSFLLSTIICFIGIYAANSWSSQRTFLARYSSIATSLAMSSTDSNDDGNNKIEQIVDRSTLTLLEHINLNVPSHEHIIPFFFNVLGCGMDPRKASNLRPDAPKKTLWANCGASQFHMPFGEEAQRIPGHIGLRFNSLEALKDRLKDPLLRSSYESSVAEVDPRTNREFVKLVDHYGNTYFCRVGDSNIHADKQQPIISRDGEEWGEYAKEYGRSESDCRGVDYVEFQCPKGSASKIALFYDSVLDATTSVVDIPNGNSIAIIGLGNIDESGKAEQSILFRETDEAIPAYDGHHIAMYVGESAADFEQAFRNTMLANIVWCNPRFSDKVDSLLEAEKEKQFRFKDIVDIETGERIMELEHEMRSIEHPSWLGEKC